MSDSSWHRDRSSDVGWTAASVGLWIADASPTATADEVACGDVRHCRDWGRDASGHHALESWSGLKRARSLAFPARSRSGQNQR